MGARHPNVLKAALLAIAISLSACDQASAPTYSTSQLAKAERVAWASKLLHARIKSLPSAVEDAHFSEFTVGRGGQLLSVGPDDFSSYLYLKVPVDAVGSWIKELRGRGAPAYAAPEGPYPPWISEADFPSLVFFEPSPLSHRALGWIGVSRKRGELFVFGRTS